MNAPRDSCSHCGAPLPEGASFCPSCGTPVEGGSTVRQNVPPHETTAAPVSVTQATPRWFGVTPPTLLLVITIVALVIGIALLVAGSLIPGLLLLGVASLLAAAVLEVARRKPDSIAVGRAARAADLLRARAGFAAQAMRTRSGARREISRRRAEALRLDAERERLLRAFGEAVYRGEDAAPLREQLDALETRRTALAAEAAQIAQAAAAEVERAARAVQPTEVRRPDAP